MIPVAHLRIGNNADIERNHLESPRIIVIFRNNSENGSGRLGSAPIGWPRRASARRAGHRVQREFNRIRRGMPRFLCAPSGACNMQAELYE
ncbi:hypothetical protein G3N57_10405 [Paraburkholderia sp. Se-20369]|nr:hypothetical protein [Paraburkholderia sp. Se-20369]